MENTKNLIIKHTVVAGRGILDAKPAYKLEETALERFLFTHINKKEKLQDLPLEKEKKVVSETMEKYKRDTGFATGVLITVTALTFLSGLNLLSRISNLANDFTNNSYVSITITQM